MAAATIVDPYRQRCQQQQYLIGKGILDRGQSEASRHQGLDQLELHSTSLRLQVTMVWYLKCHMIHTDHYIEDHGTMKNDDKEIQDNE